jgi:hypothetical protein
MPIIYRLRSIKVKNVHFSCLPASDFSCSCRYAEGFCIAGSNFAFLFLVSAALLTQHSTVLLSSAFQLVSKHLELQWMLLTEIESELVDWIKIKLH